MSKGARPEWCPRWTEAGHPTRFIQQSCRIRTDMLLTTHLMGFLQGQLFIGLLASLANIGVHALIMAALSWAAHRTSAVTQAAGERHSPTSRGCRMPPPPVSMQRIGCRCPSNEVPPVTSAYGVASESTEDLAGPSATVPAAVDLYVLLQPVPEQQSSNAVHPADQWDLPRNGGG